MNKSIRKITIQFEGFPDHDGFLIPIETKGNFVSETIQFDDNKLIVRGSPEGVTRMKKWIFAAWRKEDYKEIFRPFFKSTKPGKPIQFPLIGDEMWSITIES